MRPKPVVPLRYEQGVSHRVHPLSVDLVHRSAGHAACAGDRGRNARLSGRRQRDRRGHRRRCGAHRRVSAQRRARWRSHRAGAHPGRRGAVRQRVRVGGRRGRCRRSAGQARQVVARARCRRRDSARRHPRLGGVASLRRSTDVGAHPASRRGDGEGRCRGGSVVGHSHRRCRERRPVRHRGLRPGVPPGRSQPAGGRQLRAACAGRHVRGTAGGGRRTPSTRVRSPSARSDTCGRTDHP